MCGGHMDPNIAHILLFFDDLFDILSGIWYMNFPFSWRGIFVAAKVCVLGIAHL